MFAATVVLTCSSSALACTVVVITTGANGQTHHSQHCHSTMVAIVSPRFTRSLVSTLHAAPLCRLQTELGDSLLFERLAA